MQEWKYGQETWRLWKGNRTIKAASKHDGQFGVSWLQTVHKFTDSL